MGVWAWVGGGGGGGKGHWDARNLLFEASSDDRGGRQEGVMRRSRSRDRGFWNGLEGEGHNKVYYRTECAK